MKTIIVSIDADGEVTLETSGFKGKTCLEASEFLKQVLGMGYYSDVGLALSPIFSGTIYHEFFRNPP